MRVQRFSTLAALLVIAAAIPAMCESSTPALTVVLDYEQPHSPVSFEAMSAELKNLMRPAGVSLDVKDKALLPPNPQFNDLVVFRMTGRCDATPVPVGALSDERGPLAMAYTSDGQILPFGEVKCDRVRQSLERTIGVRLPSELDRSAYGTALGKVMAHEIYHMLAHASAHTKKGLTKEALTSSELLDDRLSFPNQALDGFRRNLH